MAAKTYQRFPLRVLRPRDPILGGTSDYAPAEDPVDIEDGFPVAFSGAPGASTGELVRVETGGTDWIAGWALEDMTDKNGVKRAAGTQLEYYQAQSQSQVLVEANLLTGAAGAQVAYVLLATDLGQAVTLVWDPNYLGAGIGGYYFDKGFSGGISAGGGVCIIASFTNTRVPSDNEESYSVAGDTDAVVRAYLNPVNFLFSDGSP